jgi:hypothetical protein
LNSTPRSNKLYRCKNCNRLFRPELNKVGRPRTTFCSSDCSKEYFNKRFDNIEDIFESEKYLTKEELSELPIGVCKNCNKEFPKSHFNRLFCSYECAIEAKKIIDADYDKKIKFQCRGKYLGGAPVKNIKGVNNYTALSKIYTKNNDPARDEVYSEEEIYGKIYNSFEEADNDYDNIDETEEFNYEDYYGDYEE